MDPLFVPQDWKGKPILKAEDLAPVLDMHVDDLYRMAASGEIPSFKLGNRRRFRTYEIVRWLAVGPNFGKAA